MKYTMLHLPLLHLWERIAFYGLHTSLLLYCTGNATRGGLGFSSTQTLELIGSYFAVVQMLPLLGGAVSDRLKNKKILLVVSFLFLGVGYYFLGHAPTTNSLLIGLFLLSLGFASIRPTLLVILAHHYPPSLSSSPQAYSWFYAASTVAVFLSGFFTGVAELCNSWPLYFKLVGALSILGAGFCSITHLDSFLLSVNLPSASEGNQLNTTGSKWPKIIWLTFIAIFFYSMSQGAFPAVILFVSDRVNRHLDWDLTHLGGSEGFIIPIGWLISCASVVTIFFSIFLGKLWNYLGARNQIPAPLKRIGWGLGLTGIGYFSLGVSGELFTGMEFISLWILLIFNFGFSGGKSLAHPALWEEFAAATPKSFHGRIMGFSLVCMGIGSVAFPFVVEAFSSSLETVGVEQAFLWGGIVTFLLGIKLSFN